MKEQALRILAAILLISILLSACSPAVQNMETTATGSVDTPPTSTPVQPTQTTVKAGPLETSTEAPAFAATPTQRTSTPTSSAPTPSAAPTQASAKSSSLPKGISFNYAAIPLGKDLQTTVDGHTISVRVNKVITGADADQIAFAKAPEEMQWTIVQLSIQYLDGEKNTRAQLVKTSMFTAISKGNQDVGQPLIAYTPSPHLEDVKLLPGEHSLGYLAFQVYQDDPAPLLRFTVNGADHFFALKDAPAPAAEPEKEVQLAADAGIGTPAQPVPAGTSAYVTDNGTVFKITVEKSLRGFDALKKIKDVFGINEDPSQGEEFVMPFVTITTARASEENTNFFLGDFTSFSNQSQLAQPLNMFCPLPCLQSATLYPGGSASGWVPLVAYQDDANPLLVFAGSVYFQIIPEQGTQSAFQRQISPDAIGYSNRDSIAVFLELQQAGPVHAITFSPDDQWVVTGGDDKVLHIWETASGKEIHTLKGSRGSIRGLSFSPDGAWLASVSNIGEVIVWDTSTWESTQTFDLKAAGLSIQFLPDGTLRGANSGGLIQYWDVHNGQPVRQEFVPRNMSSTCAGAVVQSFDSSDDGSMLAASLSCGYSAIWEAGGNKILFADSNHQNELKLRGQQPPSTSHIVLSPDGKMAAYGTVYYPNRYLTLLDIIDVTNHKVVAGVNPVDLNMVAVQVAPKRDLMMAGVGNQVIVWWPEAFVWGGKNLIKLTGHKVIVTVLEYSTSGEMLASGDYGGKTILWKAK